MTSYILQTRYWSGPDWQDRGWPVPTLAAAKTLRSEFSQQVAIHRAKHPSNDPIPQTRILKQTITRKVVR